MSRTIAKLLTGVVNTLTAPLSPRQRKRVIARVIEQLAEHDLREVETRRGTLKFHQLTSAFAASAVERFHTDEPETLAWIDGFKGGETLWDIGASIGVYSLYAALDEDLTIYAFEPSGFNFGLLIEHIAINDMGDRINPLCIALGRNSGLNKLHMAHASPGHGGNALGVARNQFRSFAPVFSQTVLAFSMDQLRERYGLTAPDHIKIDVDGIEPEIIAGARETLPEVKTLLMEIEGRSQEEIAETLERPLFAAGFEEQLSVRAAGSGRNRLFVNSSKL